ncbi:MAG: trypsin-like peptidase domain-containing protein [Oscillibacter sp.]|nr:trypsin-like peptidase domain-containing protein [Oscillibacter sp.]
MYNDEENLYHYSYRSGSERPQDGYSPLSAEPVVPQPEMPPKKNFFKKTGTKVAALALSCALLGGACGAGVVLAARSGGRASIAVSNRETTAVSVKKVDGKTAMTMSEVYASTVNSVVSINTASTTTNVFGQSVESASAGSGFIITADGYIVTNYHVISGASSVKVTLYSGDNYDATLVGGDEDYDIAVLKINAADLPAVTLGDSSAVNVGDSVAAIGNPLGELTFSMSEGIVSSNNRAINVDGTPFNMIQVDASINPGNSGGPLMNSYGEVVGIVSAKYSSYANTTVEGLGFAIPINDVSAMIKDIMENGQVTTKPYLGITAGTMTSQMASQYKIDITKGVFVYSVEAGGAGDKAGLKLGDVITKVNDTEITSMEDLSAAKKNYSSGDAVTLTIYRSGSYTTVQLTFGTAPATTSSSSGNSGSSGSSGKNGSSGKGYNDYYNYFFGNNGSSGSGN